MMLYLGSGDRVYIEFRDREYEDQWVRAVNASDLGIVVRSEKTGHLWFYPWHSILAIRLEDRSTGGSA